MGRLENIRMLSSILDSPLHTYEFALGVKLVTLFIDRSIYLDPWMKSIIERTGATIINKEVYKLEAWFMANSHRLRITDCLETFNKLRGKIAHDTPLKLEKAKTFGEVQDIWEKYTKETNKITKWQAKMEEEWSRSKT